MVSWDLNPNVTILYIKQICDDWAWSDFCIFMRLIFLFLIFLVTLLLPHPFKIMSVLWVCCVCNKIWWNFFCFCFTRIQCVWICFLVIIIIVRAWSKEFFYFFNFLQINWRNNFWHLWLTDQFSPQPETPSLLTFRPSRHLDAWVTTLVGGVGTSC